MALTYTDLNSITQKLYIPKMVDNIFDSNALLQRWKKNNYKSVDGGTKIVEPLLYDTTTAAGRYQGADTLNITGNDQFTAAEFDYKEYYASIPITRIDELKNSGKSRVISMVEAKVQAAEKTLKDIMGTDIFGDGSTANAMKGIQLICDVTGTYGGIAKGSYSWWQAQQDTTTTAFTLAAFQALFGACSIDNDRPTVAVTTQAIYDDAYGQVQPQQRFTDSSTMKAGFTNMILNGIPLIVDSHQTSGYMHLLNEKYINLRYHKDENFRFDPFKKPINQNVTVAHIFWTGALTCNNCRMQGEFSALV